MLAELEADRIAVIESMPNRLSRSKIGPYVNESLFSSREGDGTWLGNLRLSVGRSRPLIEQSLGLPLEFFGRLSFDSCSLCRPVPNRSGVLKRPERTRRSGTGRTLLTTLVLSRCSILAQRRNDGRQCWGSEGCYSRRNGGAPHSSGPSFRSLTVDTVMKIAFLHSLTSHKHLTLAEPFLAQESLRRDPTFSIFRIGGIGALNAERKGRWQNSSPSAPSFRSELERRHFRHAQLCAGNAAARSSRKRAYFRAVAANERIGRMTRVKSTAGSHGSAARHGGEFR